MKGLKNAKYFLSQSLEIMPSGLGSIPFRADPGMGMGQCGDMSCRIPFRADLEPSQPRHWETQTAVPPQGC